MIQLRERLPAVVVEPTINCASIQPGYIKLEEAKGKRLVALAQDNHGNWYMWAEVHASELIYRKRMAVNPEGIDPKKWDGKKRIYEGGLEALNSNINEAREELQRLQRECPDFSSSEIILGRAVELIDESEIDYPRDDYDLWMKLEAGGDVKTAFLLDGRTIDFSSKPLPKPRGHALPIGF